MSLREEIKIILKDVLKENSIDISVDEIEIEKPAKEKFGDFASPVIMYLAKKLRTNPIALGEKVFETLKSRQYDIFKDINFVKPGFLNFFISSNRLVEEIQTIYKEKENYGINNNQSGENIILEFVSANPTGPLNVVSARAAAVGDVLAKLLAAQGNKVFKEYYINDAGKQVYLLGKSVLYRIKEILGENVVFPEDGYHGEYIKDIAREVLNSDLYNEIENLSEEEQIFKLRDYTIEKIVSSQKEDLKNFNVEFDNWFSEQKLRDSDTINRCLDILKQKNLIYEQDKKLFFKSTDFGDEKDRVIIRDDGSYTYFLVDIAYHLTKFERGFNKLIDIWGPDHDGYIPRMKGAVEALDYNKEQFTVFIVQQVNLIENSQKVKMSKRLGRFVLMRELIADIGVDVARFFFLHRSVSSHLDFDIELAKKHSDENPVFYVQYAHARICNIFKQADEKGIKYNLDNVNLSLIGNNEEERKLMKILIDYPEVLKTAAEKFQPNLVTNYLLDLAAAFHKFYTEHRVLDAEQDLINARLFLINACKIIFKNGFDLVGITAPERM